MDFQRREGPTHIALDRSIFLEPFVAGLHEQQVKVTYAQNEAALIELFLAGEVDCVLVSPLSYAHHPSVESEVLPMRNRIIPGIGLWSKEGPPNDVLVSRLPFEEVKTVDFDPHRGDSGALARIILDHRTERLPEFRADPTLIDKAARNDISNLDCVLLSADTQLNMLARSEGVETLEHEFPHHLDLGAEWNEITGTPYLHRIWLARYGAPLSQLRSILSRAYQVSQAETLDEAASETRRIAAASMKSVNYAFGSLEVEGFREFLVRAARLNLCSEDLAVVFC